MNFREELALLDIEISNLKNKRLNFIKDTQNKCVHPEEQIIQSSYISSTEYAYAKQESRVCRLCGLLEADKEFKKLLPYKLTFEVPQLDRDRIFAFAL